MNKKAVLILTAAMISVSAATVTTFAAEQENDFQISGQQMPEMSESNNQGPQFGEQQFPQASGQQAPAENGGQQLPQASGQQAPTENGGRQNRPGMQRGGRGSEKGFGIISFDEYVKNGTISQETCDAIKKYMEEHKPELPEGAQEGQRPEKPEGMQEGERPDLLKDLLQDGVITQEEYNALSAAREASEQEKPAKPENVETQQENNNA